MDYWLLFIALLGLIIITWKSHSKVIETFNDLQEGELDMRTGSLGGSNAKTKGGWINVASFSLSTANQEINIILEVFGDARQTFLLNIANDLQKVNINRFVQKNQFGNDIVVFNTATLVQSGSGLATSQTIYLQMARDGCQNVPITWYLKGASTKDIFALSNSDMTTPPTGGSAPSVIDDSSGAQSKIDALSAAVLALQNVLDSKDPSILMQDKSLAMNTSLTSPDGKSVLIMQGDGNLVAYSNGQAKWATNSNGKGKAPYNFIMQSDGNGVVYASGAAIWASNTWGQGTQPFKLVFGNNSIAIKDSTGKSTWTANF